MTSDRRIDSEPTMDEVTDNRDPARSEELAALQRQAHQTGRALFLVAVPEADRERLVAAMSAEEGWGCVALDPRAALSDAPSDARSDEEALTAALLRRISSDDRELRLEAVEALSGLAVSEDPAVMAALLRALEDSAAPVREAAARAFERLGRLDVLVDGLSEARAASRRSAAWALGHVGEAGRPAVPDLIRALSDPDPATRRAVAWALERITTAPLSDEAALPRERSELSPRELLDLEEFERWLRAGVRPAYGGRPPEHPGQLRLYGSRSGRARVS